MYCPVRTRHRTLPHSSTGHNIAIYRNVVIRQIRSQIRIQCHRQFAVKKTSIILCRCIFNLPFYDNLSIRYTCCLLRLKLRKSNVYRRSDVKLGIPTDIGNIHPKHCRTI